MKCLIFLLLLASCHQKKKEAQKETATTSGLIHTYDISIRTEEDSGYYKGEPPLKLNYLEVPDTTQLSRFLSKLISKKDIILLDSQTLSHSVYINQKEKVRFDTLRNDRTILTSKYRFNGRESQVIKLNGKVIKDYHWDGSESDEEPVLDFYPESFRHFSFKGKEFYYIRARVMDGFSGSIHTLRYHLICTSSGSNLAIFQTCRFEEMLFGDADGDDKLDYLDFRNFDFCPGVPLSGDVTIELFSCNNNGVFVFRENAKGVLYSIKGNTGEGLGQDSFKVILYSWPHPIPD